MNFEKARRAMVRTQVEARGISDRRVLEAMLTVPRERFVSDEQRKHAYSDGPLPIESGQTISQPYIVALMAEALAVLPGDRVLEVGAGSGYAAAVLSRLAKEVYAVERHAVLVELSRRRLAELGYENVHIKHANGTLGWPEYAPYDAISVAAGGPEIAESLLAQLAIGGRLVMPVGENRRSQDLVRIVRTGAEGFERTSLGEVRFVPLIGRGGWSEVEDGA